jgi:hypothetical protein
VEALEDVVECVAVGGTAAVLGPDERGDRSATEHDGVPVGQPGVAVGVGDGALVLAGDPALTRSTFVSGLKSLPIRYELD